MLSEIHDERWARFKDMYIGTLGVRVRESQYENKTELKGEYQEEFFFPAKVLR